MEEENYDKVRSQWDNDADSINNQVIADNKTSRKSENNNLNSEKSTDYKKKHYDKTGKHIIIVASVIKPYTN